jgi:hypothetical protein
MTGSSNVRNAKAKPGAWRAFTVIAGDRDAEWTEAEMRRYCFPTVKALPFIKLKKDHQPGWHPESFWCVQPTGRWEKDYELGKIYARQCVAAMQADGCNVLSHVFDDMIRDGIERQKKKAARRRCSPAVVGFLHQLANMLDPLER